MVITITNALLTNHITTHMFLNFPLS